MSSNRLFLRTLVLKISPRHYTTAASHGDMLEMQTLAALPFPCHPPLFQRNEAKTLNPEGLLKRLLASLQVIQSLELAVPTNVKDVPTHDSKILILGLCPKTFSRVAQGNPYWVYTEASTKELINELYIHTIKYFVVVKISKPELYVLPYLKHNMKKGDHLYKNLKHTTYHYILFMDIHMCSKNINQVWK